MRSTLSSITLHFLHLGLETALYVEEGVKDHIKEHRAVQRSWLVVEAFSVARRTYICAFWNTKYYFLTWDRLEPRHLAKEQIFHSRICRPDLRRAASLT